MPLNVTNELLSPEEAFEKYGYVLDEPSGLYRKSRGPNGFNLATEQWLKTDYGWLCFVGPRTGFGEIPFGWPAIPISGRFAQAQMITSVKDGSPVFADAPMAVVGLVQVPVGPADDYALVSGTHPASHPQAYRWAWTDDEVSFMYQFAEEGWAKQQDESGVITMVREK